MRARRASARPCHRCQSWDWRHGHNALCKAAAATKKAVPPEIAMLVSVAVCSTQDDRVLMSAFSLMTEQLDATSKSPPTPVDEKSVRAAAAIIESCRSKRPHLPPHGAARLTGCQTAVRFACHRAQTPRGAQ